MQNAAENVASKITKQPQYQLLRRWLGRQDLNLGMAESKSAALPLGYAPKRRRIAAACAGSGGRRTIATSSLLINVHGVAGRCQTAVNANSAAGSEAPSMSKAAPSIIETRRDQILPQLDATDIERARRFGEVRSFAAGEALANVGKVGIGLAIILEGHVDVYRYDAHGKRQHFYAFEPGSFLGELAQLDGRPSFGDAVTTAPVKALVFSPDRMRALLIAEADLGERLMRALILRRTQMLREGIGGPVIVGRQENPNVLRLESFLARNGTPRMRLDPDTDADAKALVERFHVDPGQLPIVLCPGGQVLHNPSEDELARCIGLVGPIDPTGFTTSPSSVPAPPALPPPSMPHPRDFRCWRWTAAHSAGRPAPRPASKITLAFRPASPAWR